MDMTTYRLRSDLHIPASETSERRSVLPSIAGVGVMFAVAAMVVALRLLATAHLYPHVGEALTVMLPF
jgi:hypothetical protein